RHSLYAMIIYYAAQRFVWEFLKPYPRVVGPLNVFHILMLGLAAYGIFWWRRDRGNEPAPAGAAATAAQVRSLSVPRADDEPVRDVPGAGPRQDHHRG